MSVVILRLFLFLLPFLLFLLWLWAVRRMRLADGKVPKATERLITWGGAIFIALFMLGLFLYGQLNTAGDGKRGSKEYVPARTENGKVIPGYFVEKADEAESGASSNTDDANGTDKPDG